MPTPCVLIFAGNDPSGGAGLAADIQAVTAQGAHPLPVLTAVTVQDNDRVFAVYPLPSSQLLEQAQALANKISIGAIKSGIVANRANAVALAQWIRDYKRNHPQLPVILDPVLASGHGDLLSAGDAVDALAPLLTVATLITPNLPEAARLCPSASTDEERARYLMQYGAQVLIKGGHGTEAVVTNHWYHADQVQRWHWQRLAGEFHGSGCTLASAIAAQLALGLPVVEALDRAQHYCHRSLLDALTISDGQLIPKRQS